jgi:hypothetical protein
MSERFVMGPCPDPPGMTFGAVWTKRAPKMYGWYWWRRSIEFHAEIVQVVPGGGLGACVDGKNIRAVDFGGEWYGPLIEPGGDAIENCRV